MSRKRMTTFFSTFSAFLLILSLILTPVQVIAQSSSLPEGDDGQEFSEVELVDEVVENEDEVETEAASVEMEESVAGETSEEAEEEAEETASQVDTAEASVTSDEVEPSVENEAPVHIETESVEQESEADEAVEDFSAGVEEETEILLDYDDEFSFYIDNESVTSDSITVEWEYGGDVIPVEVKLYLDHENVATVSGNEKSYTFDNLIHDTEYHIELYAVLENGDEYFDDTWIYTKEYEGEVVPVRIITVLNDDPNYYEKIKIRGLDEENRSFVYEAWIDSAEPDLYLPLGNLELVLYDSLDPSISESIKFEIKKGVDYISKPLQFTFKLKEMREDSEPLDMEVVEIDETSFTVKWSNIDKLLGIEFSTVVDDRIVTSNFLESDLGQYTFTELSPNLLYYINYKAKYKYDIDYDGDFNVKTEGKDAEAPVVEFEDEQLKDGVQKEAGVHTRDATEADLLHLTELDLPKKRIVSLQGLQHAVNLEFLVLRANEIADISELSGLTEMIYLDLRENSIEDIASLERLTQLEYLYLSENRIHDVSSLKSMKKLYDLDLYNNELENIKAIAELDNLHYLDLGDNKIVDISPLENLKDLYELDLRFNKISNIDVISNLEKLNYLSLGWNSITDISALKNLTNLETLSLTDNHISNIEPLRNLVNLDWLFLDYNDITRIDDLSTLTELRSLDLSSNRISDIKPIEKLTNLIRLHLSDNEIKDISPLKKLTDLAYLELDRNPIEDLSPLLELSNLQTLYINGVELSEEDIDILQSLANDGVEVYYDDWNDWNDWDDLEGWDPDVVDWEAVMEVFPEESGFIVEPGNREVVIDLSQTDSVDEFVLTPEQTQMLIENNQQITLQKDDVEVTIPGSAFDHNAEPVTISMLEFAPVPNSLSATYDFTIKQGTRTISSFEEGVTLTFNVNAERAKNPKNLKVFYYNEETGEWENVGGTYHNGTVTTVVAHFSIFTVFEVGEDGDTIVEIDKDPQTPGRTDETDEKNESDSETDVIIDEKEKEKEKAEEKVDEKVTEEKAEEKTEEKADKEQVVVGKVDQDKEGNKLPKTATDMYATLLIGLIVFLTGIWILLFIKYRKMKEAK